ncbi:serine hydrolase domain-containing protein [Falsiroseomonas sp. HW251]|uniref:serine hydrolase domain-containing protein n=1 Tax=Falsiroseomonas sp. HW251 TaxID=3390998 RepID=UPI003D31BFE6
MRRRGMLAAPAALIAAAPASAQQLVQGPLAAPLEPLLEPIRAAHGLPALAAAVVRDGRIVAAGATGTRRAGASIPVTREDRFHLGSDTKAMTATLAATEVEAGRIGWETTLGSLFPDVAPMDGGLAGVTLVQFLSHASGLPPDDQSFVTLMLAAYSAGSDDSLNLDEMRLWMLREWAKRPLAAAPGTPWAYANMNYILAACMIERVTRRTWEELVAERIFAPLGLSSAGFGPQSSPGLVDAPLPHFRRADGSLKPMLAGPNADVPAPVGPAGNVHLSILDFAAWASWNAGEGRRGPAIIRPETLKLLHTPRIAIPPRPGDAPGVPGEGGYAMGWGVVRQGYSTEPFVTHTGSNGMNRAVAYLQPALDFAMVLATNCSDAPADEAHGQAAVALYRRFGPARSG